MLPSQESQNELRALSGWDGEFTLGYLLRKLPGHIEIHKLSHKQTFYAEQRKTPFAAIRCDAATPEDAACKLCIVLFKEGVLKREE